ncbi:GlcG/HbpS family heme-binding protein [Azohydromonas australica]|uniref:GlcG/HbpS family heme-binding protein n=1 Tax=Azohydromonas australica TaxID=364039 RepID=UPI000406325D|nr:heme-binding protein [Azohydromonas australica]
MSIPARIARLALTAAALATATGLVSAQSAPPAPAVRTERTLSAELAGQIAVAAVAACQANGHAVAATVVDRSGGVRAVLRADAAGSHTLEASRLKAYTSASARNATLAMMDSAQKNPGAANLVNIPGFLLLGGGVPVKAGNEVIGAVGVGGAPGGHLDEQCALAALEKIKTQLQ